MTIFHAYLIHTPNEIGDPTVASVWRRQTFSAAVEAFTPEMSNHILSDGIPEVLTYLSEPTCPQTLLQGLRMILDSAYDFSRMLHASKSSSGGQSGGADAFYRSFVPELGSVLYPRQIELLKRCRKHESGEVDRVGACVFPVSFLLHLSKGPPGEEVQILIIVSVFVVRVLLKSHEG